MWSFFENLYSAGGFIGGIFVRLGQINYASFVRLLISDISFTCTNLFTGASFDFSLNVFTAIGNMAGNDFVGVLLRLFTLLPQKVLTLVNTVVGYMMSPTVLFLPSNTPAFIGVAVYFVFFIGIIKLAITAVSKLVSILTGTLFGGKE